MQLPSDTVVLAAVLNDLKSSPFPLYIDTAVLSADPRIASIEHLPLSGDFANALEDRGFIDDSVGSANRAAFAAARGYRVRSVKAVQGCIERRMASRFGADCFGMEDFRVVIVAQPRAGGPYLPGVIDERQSGSRDLASVRVIYFEVVGKNTSQAASDYVFERRNGTWTFLKKIVLVFAG
jgi:hypothetical protein